MSKLPRNIKPQKLLKALEKLGFTKTKGKGRPYKIKTSRRKMDAGSCSSWTNSSRNSSKNS